MLVPPAIFSQSVGLIVLYQTNLSSKTIIKDEYTNNKNIPGEYVIELNYEYENGESINVETKIIVDGKCCAGVTVESHKTALEAMKAVQIEILD